jgi:hypothetical protein
LGSRNRSIGFGWKKWQTGPGPRRSGVLRGSSRKVHVLRDDRPLPPRTRRSNAIHLRVASSILAFLLAVWIFYPVEVYQGHIPTYLAVAEIDRESTFAGLVNVPPCEHPVFAAREQGKR